MVSIRRYLPMKIVKKRCEICRKWFMPDPRTYKIQKCCSKCRKKRKAQTDKIWRENNPGYDKYRKDKKREWARAYPDYWRKYRAEHPVYVEENNKRRSSRHKKAKNAANQVTISKIFVDELKSIRENRPDSAANQVTIDRRVDDLFELLIWKDSAANQADIDWRCLNNQK
jgi:hypothetical protein